MHKQRVVLFVSLAFLTYYISVRADDEGLSSPVLKGDTNEEVTATQEPPIAPLVPSNLEVTDTSTPSAQSVEINKEPVLVQPEATNKSEETPAVVVESPQEKTSSLPPDTAISEQKENLTGSTAEETPVVPSSEQVLAPVEEQKSEAPDTTVAQETPKEETQESSPPSPHEEP